MADLSSRVPLSFEANQGQTDPQVKFLSRASQYTLFLTRDQAVFAFGTGTQDSVLRMQLLNTDSSASIEGMQQLAAQSNYFKGNDPAHWHANVKNYARVGYRSVYPGIDLIYYGNQSQLEYDFAVAPGANPSLIGFALAGAKHVSVGTHGELVIQFDSGYIQFHKPVAYTIGAQGERDYVDAEYKLTAENTVSFELGPHDRSRRLIIDPVLSLSTYLGGSNKDVGFAVAVDKSGNVYVTGTTRSADFPTMSPIEGFHGGSCSGQPCRDVYVTKFNKTLSALIFSTFLGGTNDEIPVDITLDSKLNVYVTGSTLSPDYPTTVGAFQTVYGGSGFFNTGDAFVTKIAATGNSLAYSTFLGGSGDENSYIVAVDSKQNAYVTGFTTSSNFPGTPGAFRSSCTNSPCFNAYVTKLNSTGTGLVYSTFIGGSGAGVISSANALAIDSKGNAYVGGVTGSPDFPVTSGAYDTVCGTDANCNGTEDGFIFKLNPSGSQLVYSTFLGGSGFDYVSDVRIDATGAVYASGTTVSQDFPVTAGAPQPIFKGGSGCQTYNCGDAFLAKLNPAGSGLVYSTYLGGSGDEGPFRGAVDAAGNFYAPGETTSTDFPVVNAIQPAYGGGSRDGFVTEINAAGTAFAYSTFLGGSDQDFANGLTIDAWANVFVVGGSQSINFPVTPGVFQPLCGTDGNCNNGFLDSTVTKISHLADLGVTDSAPGNVNQGSTLTYTITVTNNGPDQAITIKASDTVPSGTTFNSVSVPAGVTCTHPGAGGSGSVACTITSLDSGASVVETLVVNVTANPGATITDKVSLNWGGADPNKKNNSATAKTTVN